MPGDHDLTAAATVVDLAEFRRAARAALDELDQGIPLGPAWLQAVLVASAPDLPPPDRQLLHEVLGACIKRIREGQRG